MPHTITPHSEPSSSVSSHRTTPQSILVTGAATGIGRAVALKFLDAGWIVGAYDIDDAGLEQLKRQHPEIITGHLDVTDYDQWERALEDFTSHTGGTLTVLDNNAGVISDGDITVQAPGLIAAQVNVNCTGVTLGARAAHPYLKKTPGAQLVNMGSASALYGQPHIAPYSASKFYVSGLGEALDLEWHDDDIRVVTIMPLWAKTTLSDVSAPSVQRLGVNITPEQIADKIWEATHPTGFLSRRRRVYSVSLLDLAFRYASAVSPRPLVRLINKAVSS